MPVVADYLHCNEVVSIVRGIDDCATIRVVAYLVELDVGVSDAVYFELRIADVG